MFAAIEARTAGYGGIVACAQATGTRSTIGRGLKDLDDPASLSGVVRRSGSGRPALTETDRTLLEDLGRLLEPATKGDPMRPLRWVSKSHAKLAAALGAMGHKVSKSTIPKLLEVLQYRRQVNRKTLESSRNPDRDAQFEHINAAVIAMQAAGKPVIYLNEVNLARHQSWGVFARWCADEKLRLVLFTTKAGRSYLDHGYGPRDILLFGRESAGVPERVHAAAAVRLLVPMRFGMRALNVAMSCAMAVGEALRQRREFVP